MQLKNYMEDVVIAVYEKYVSEHPEVCRCQQCRLDIIALALTRLRGMYAATPEGDVLQRVLRDDRQVRADALIAIIESVGTVSNRPQHKH